MSAGSTIPAATLRAAMLAAGDRVCEERDALCALDALAGDGDLGATLATGFAHLRATLEQLDGADAGRLLLETGTQLARNAPSTIGALLGTAFVRAGAALQGVSELEPRHVTRFLVAALQGVAERGGASVGQRTVVDALDGSAHAAAEAEAQGLLAGDVLQKAAEGAVAGAEATATMEPQFGRAAWISDRARGNRDAGAVAWATYLGALAEACTGARTKEASSGV